MVRLGYRAALLVHPKFSHQHERRRRELFPRQHGWVDGDRGAIRMMMDRTKFFPRARSTVFRGYMTQPQVDGLNALLDAWDASGLTDSRYLAYMLATAYHETAATMQPVPEIGKGRGRAYGVKVDGKVYYGRGYVQLTWRSNYAAMSPIVGADLVSDPDLALKPDIAAKVMFYGMEHGTFTGKKLADYFNVHITDFLNARRIINGMDRAAQIAVYAREFYAAIGESSK